MNLLPIIVLMLLSTMGPSMVIAIIGFAGITALGRNPSSAPRIQTMMIMGFIFAESIAVIALLVIFQLFAGGL